MAHLHPLAIEDHVDLLEIGLGVRGDLLGGEDRPGLGPAARVSDHRRVVADDQDHRVPLVLERAERVEHDQVTHVEIWRRRVESQLDLQPVPAFQSSLEVIGDMNLHRPLAKALEELCRHTLNFMG